MATKTTVTETPKPPEGEPLEGDPLENDNDGETLDSFFEVKIPPILANANPPLDLGEDDWIKVMGWYNELNFFSKVFQFFGEVIKETESTYGWWVILISSLSSFITLFTIDPFDLNDIQNTYYIWIKSIILSLLSISTTLIASWTKKKAYVKRIQEIDKRISRLEKFLGKLDYQFRLVPKDKREEYFKFITDMRDEYNELSIYTNLISPSEFTRTVYIITRFNTPIIRGAWPWYDTITKKPRKEFARHIIDTYESQFSWISWLKLIFCCQKTNDASNPLLQES